MARASHNLTANQFTKVKIGMTEREVEAARGMASGDYSKGGESTVVFSNAVPHKTWLGRESGLTVFFDPAGRVSGSRIYPVIRR